MVEWDKVKILDIWNKDWYKKNLPYEIEKCEFQTLAIILPQEYDVSYDGIFGWVDFTHYIDNLLIKNNKILYVFSGNKTEIISNILYRNIKYIYWDSIDIFSRTSNYYFENKNYVLKNHFTGMINLKRGRLWRHYIVNEIFKNDLFKYGEFAFRMENADIEAVSNKFQYIDHFVSPYLFSEYIIDSWEPHNIKLDDIDDIDFNQFIIPEKYMESSFDIVVETLYHSFFITEKTIRPIKLKKPFIVFSGVHFHRNLQDYGFKLYDEIINYDFDKIINVTDRFDVQILQLKNIKDKYSPEEIFNLTNDKTIFNYNKLIEYGNKKTPSYIPDELWNFMNNKIYKNCDYNKNNI